MRQMAEDKPSPSLSATQEIAQPTVADVMEVFHHFQADILQRIDKRDENVLTALRTILSDVLKQYQTQTSRSDDHERRIRALEKALERIRDQHNEIASEVTTLKIKANRGER